MMEYVLILGVGVSVIGGLLYLMVCGNMRISPFSPKKGIRERDRKRQEAYDWEKKMYLDDMAREVKKRLERDDFV